MKRVKLQTLQGLRALAFLCVCISHTGPLEIECMGMAAVSVFLILSGFLLTYNYHGRDHMIEKPLLFAIKKIWYLYPLHIVCMIAIILMYVRYSVLEETNVVIDKVILNIAMIQEWIPKYGSISINGTSWYLCTLLFTYIMFPYINQIMERKYSKKTAYLMILLSIIMQFIVGIFAKGFSSYNVDHDIGIKRNIIGWLTYYFPLSRIWDFFIGNNLAYLFLHRNQKNIFNKKITYSVIEVLVVSLWICSIAYGQVIYLNDHDQWYTYVLLYTGGSALLVYFFSVGRGIISKILTNNVTIFLARVSPFGFLIHYVVFEWTYCILWSELKLKEFTLNYRVWVNITIGMLLTIAISELYRILISRLLKLPI